MSLNILIVSFVLFLRVVFQENYFFFDVHQPTRFRNAFDSSVCITLTLISIEMHLTYERTLIHTNGVVLYAQMVSHEGLMIQAQKEKKKQKKT